MRKKLTHALAAFAALAMSAPAFADGPGYAGPDVAAPPVRAEPAPPVAEPAADGRTGQIALDELTLSVPQGYRFYDAAQARAYLQRNNASAPAGVIYGLVARADADITRPGTWATVISYDAIGYVQPETAAGLSDSNFEADVRAARSAQSRVFEGFAAQPAFDAASPNLVWAERAGRPGATGADMRFEQKAPGRFGVACMTSIGSADQLPQMQAAAGDLRAMLSFPEGRRHADFQPATDQVSSYTVPGLVTGVARAEPQALADTASAGGAGGTAQTGFGGLAGWFPWLAIGIVVLAIVGYMLMRRRRDAGEEA